MGQIFSSGGLTNPDVSSQNQAAIQKAGGLSFGQNPPTMLAENDPTSGGPTKGNKLMQILRYGIAGAEGALAGRAASEQMVAQTGGRRSGGVGSGFMAGYQSPFTR